MRTVVGMTIWEAFATAALGGLCASAATDEATPEQIAVLTREIADAMEEEAKRHLALAKSEDQLKMEQAVKDYWSEEKLK